MGIVRASDDSCNNAAMSRSHTWVKRGTEFIDPVLMHEGKTLTLIGAIRLHGWVVLRTMFATANAERFVAWLTTHLLPRLQAGDVVVMDNLRAHHDPRVVSRCRARGVRLLYLPPYSPDLNPIEAGWALQKQHLRKYVPRSPTTCAEWPAAPAIASHPTIATSGSLMRVTKLNSGDRWG